MEKPSNEGNQLIPLALCQLLVKQNSSQWEKAQSILREYSCSSDNVWSPALLGVMVWLRCVGGESAESLFVEALSSHFLPHVCWCTLPFEFISSMCRSLLFITRTILFARPSCIKPVSYCCLCRNVAISPWNCKSKLQFYSTWSRHWNPFYPILPARHRSAL